MRSSSLRATSPDILPIRARGTQTKYSKPPRPAHPAQPVHWRPKIKLKLMKVSEKHFVN